MAHKKGVGSTDNGRDSISKRLGVKLFGGQAATAGNIIIRQRGTKYHPGENVYMGKDFTLHARVDGTVVFTKRRKNRVFVSIEPADVVATETATKPVPKKRTMPAPATPVVEATLTPEEPVAVAPEVKEEKVEEKAPKAKAAPAPQEEAPAAKEEPKAEAPKKEAKATEAKAEEPKAEAKKEKPAAPAPKAKKAGAKIELPSGKKIKQDDLKMVEGIGPKIEGLLHEGGIETWEDLANAPTEKVQAILDEAGPRYRMHDPATWAKQAKFAHEGKWAELEAYQDRLEGGREPKADDTEK